MEDGLTLDGWMDGRRRRMRHRGWWLCVFNSIANDDDDEEFEGASRNPEVSR